jgi:hypothetical protein
MRIEPPPSLPCAIGTIPVATATAAPPLEPPLDRVRSQGLRVGPPFCTASVVGAMQNSGTVVRPKGRKPSARNRVCKVASMVEVRPANSREPTDEGRKVEARPESFKRKGSAPNRPFGLAFRTRSSAASPRR